jgi:hypothetical protein
MGGTFMKRWGLLAAVLMLLGLLSDSTNRMVACQGNVGCSQNWTGTLAREEEWVYGGPYITYPDVPHVDLTRGKEVTTITLSPTTVTVSVNFFEYYLQQNGSLTTNFTTVEGHGEATFLRAAVSMQVCQAPDGSYTLTCTTPSFDRIETIRTITPWEVSERKITQRMEPSVWGKGQAYRGAQQLWDNEILFKDSHVTERASWNIAKPTVIPGPIPTNFRLVESGILPIWEIDGKVVWNTWRITYMWDWSPGLGGIPESQQNEIQFREVLRFRAPGQSAGPTFKAPAGFCFSSPSLEFRPMSAWIGKSGGGGRPYQNGQDLHLVTACPPWDWSMIGNSYVVEQTYEWSAPWTAGYGTPDSANPSRWWVPVEGKYAHNFIIRRLTGKMKYLPDFRNPTGPGAWKWLLYYTVEKHGVSPPDPVELGVVPGPGGA